MTVSAASQGSFSPVAAKFDHAGKHLNALNGKVRRWCDAHPFTLHADPNGESTEHRIYIRFQRKPKTILWGLVFGDALHNLRATLDHLIYQLAIRVTGQDPPPDSDKLAFPIAHSEDSWNGQAWRIACLSGNPVWTFIQNEQPYKVQPPNPIKLDPLWVLRELDDAAKHRVIQPVGGAILDINDITVITATGCQVEFMPAHVPLEDKATMMRITTIPRAILKMDAGRGTIRLGIKAPEGIGFEAGDFLGIPRDAFDRVGKLLHSAQTQFFPESL